MLPTSPRLSRRAAGAAGGSPTSSRATQPHDTSRQPTSSSGSLCTLPTPQQALDAACHHLQLARTDIEVLRCVGSLALALGARRAERGSIKALHAVLLQRVQPGMSNVEAWTSTGASMSSFAKWRRRVHTSGPVAPLLGSGWRTQSGVVPLSWEDVARQWHAKNPGWGCSALAQTAPKTAATAQLAVEALAEEGAAVAHQSGCAPQRLATHGPHQPRIIALNRAGAGLGAELHQGTKRLRQTGSCSLAEAAASEGTQHIEEGPKDQRNQEPRGSRVTSFVPPKRPSPPTKAPAPPAKKAYTNPYLVFCREQRPLLPPSLNNKEREKRLSIQWKALSVAEKAVYRARLLQGDGALATTPAPTNTLLPSA